MNVMPRRWLLFLVAAAAGCASPANGASPAHGSSPEGRRPVLVELFTSQGCSACPPADAFVRQLPSLGFGRDKVIPLTFHVDYWDRLGWKDPFANGAFTRRQEWYADSGKLRSPDGSAGLDGLYTPQMVVAGSVQFSGQRRETALREMALAGLRPPRFDLTVGMALRGATVDLTVQSTVIGERGPDKDWRLVAALAARSARTVVARGENAGEILDSAAVVRALSDRVTMPPPGSSTRIALSKPADLAWSDCRGRRVCTVRGDARNRSRAGARSTVTGLPQAAKRGPRRGSVVAVVDDPAAAADRHPSAIGTPGDRLGLPGVGDVEELESACSRRTGPPSPTEGAWRAGRRPRGRKPRPGNR